MLTEAQFAEQQRSLGRRIYEHDGVFWEEGHPFYCRPAFVYRTFTRGEVRPPRFRSLIGYSHLVPYSEQGNRVLPVMALSRERLDGFGLLKLPPKKRNQVRRALEHCQVRLLADLESVLERMREINLSQSLRQERGAGAETPACRYTEEADEWRAQMRREFALAGREWWGAFADGVLAAYLRTYQVNSIRVIQQTSSDTACRQHHPMDALYFNVLAAASADSGCLVIYNGGPMHASLNLFKEQYLFQAVDCPVYSSSRWVGLGRRRQVSSAAMAEVEADGHSANSTEDTRG